MRTIGLLLLVVVVLTGCPQEESGAPPESRIVQQLFVEFDQALAVPSSVLTFRMKGSDRLVATAAEVVFSGNFDYNFIALPTEDDFDRTEIDRGDILIKVPVELGFWSQAAAGGGFSGNVAITLTDDIGVVAEGEFENASLAVESNVVPNVASVQGGDAYVNETQTIQGTNFLRPEEGTTWAVVTGAFTKLDESTFDVVAQRFPIRWTGSRIEAEFPIDPAAFGVQLGTFVGELTFENELRTGQKFSGNSQTGFEVTLQQSFLANFSESQGSRGQKIELLGRGFVPQNSDAQYGMLLRFEGTLEFDDGSRSVELTGDDVLERAPDDVLSDERALMAVYYDIVGTTLTGLGAKPGKFTGTITPILFDQRGDQIGVEWQGTFRVLPTKQLVFIKYLPGFSKALEKYGLTNVEFEVRKKILAVTNRDYGNVNVEFVDTEPTNFIDYATIEIGGPDPTGGNKFGYDNTCNVQSQKCKDTDNLFLADYLGGVNQNSANEFNTPFGGVFIESFDFFSPTLYPDNVDASDEFDRILGQFMPTLGGTPIRGTEYPGGERDAAVEEAIDMVAAVIGNTCTHEVGHSLGLTFFPQDRIRPGEQYHNKLPCDYCIMDPGSERPFEERGELIDGTPRFNSRNAEYLQEILPLP